MLRKRSETFASVRSIWLDELNDWLLDITGRSVFVAIHPSTSTPLHAKRHLLGLFLTRSCQRLPRNSPGPNHSLIITCPRSAFVQASCQPGGSYLSNPLFQSAGTSAKRLSERKQCQSVWRPTPDHTRHPARLIDCKHFRKNQRSVTFDKTDRRKVRCRSEIWDTIG